MSFLRRLTAAISSVLVLQLTLLGSGAPGAMHGAGAKQGAAAQRATTGAVTSPQPAPAHTAGLPHDCDQPTDGTGCSHPGTVSQCATMPTCTTAAAPAAVLAATATAQRYAQDRAARASFHSRHAAAPELPPPRAPLLDA